MTRLFCQNCVDELYALDEHAGDMERTLEDITLGRLSHRAVAVKITEPFAIHRVGEIFV